jgi:hypothetical protein
MNETSQGNKIDSLPKTGKASGIMKKVTGQLKSTEKQKRDAEKSRKRSTAPQGRGGEAKVATTRSPGSPREKSPGCRRSPK